MYIKRYLLCNKYLYESCELRRVCVRVRVWPHCSWFAFHTESEPAELLLSEDQLRLFIAHFPSCQEVHTRLCSDWTLVGEKPLVLEKLGCIVVTRWAADWLGDELCRRAEVLSTASESKINKQKRVLYSLCRAIAPLFPFFCPKSAITSTNLPCCSALLRSAPLCSQLLSCLSTCLCAIQPNVGQTLALIPS